MVAEVAREVFERSVPGADPLTILELGGGEGALPAIRSTTSSGVPRIEAWRPFAGRVR